VSDTTIHEKPVELLQTLIRFDTTNPPGNEKECIEYIANLMRGYGIEPLVLAKDPKRPNLVARLTGRGEAPPLLIYGHIDVVTAQGQAWTHSPFAGEIHDGFLWGRGTLDMKGAVAMYLAAFLRTASEGPQPAGDVILCILSDEEDRGVHGAEFIVNEHPHLFDDVCFAIGEGGGFTFYVGDRCFFPIMVAERQVCWMRLTVHGPGGHGSMPVRGGAMARAARILSRLDQRPLPVHITPITRMMIEGLADGLPFPQNVALRQLLNPLLTDRLLAALGTQGRLFAPLLHNTVSATVIHGGYKTNVIPSEVTLELDGRLLPGFTFEDMQRELRAVIGLGVEYDLQLIDYYQNDAPVRMDLFDMLSGILRKTEPSGRPIPLLMSGVTDGRFFSRLGIQTYGFVPMRLPAGVDLIGTIHGADERMPVSEVSFGAQAMYEVIRQYQ